MIRELQAEHRAYLQPRISSVYLGGPLFGEDGEARIGGLLLMEFESQPEAEKFFAEQPFAKAGIIEQIQIHPFVPFIQRGEAQFPETGEYDG